ncbi:MAG: histidine kinase dimerization/phospho-acceptor domain-containing protein [bacterium]|nr:histidine kinase dimerization/phospho-acceptor domain-containing protein [bacterium]
MLLANRALAPAQLALARQQSFISDASHELRTPLTLIRANAEVLLRHRDRPNPGDAGLVLDIVAETEHMDRLTTNLLTLARLDAGQFHLEREPIDLREVAESVARRLAPLARQKDVAVHEDYGTETRLLGDRQALEQAALILLENAIKFTPPGGTVTLRTSASDGLVNLVVEDTGVGISAEHLSRLGVCPRNGSRTGP